MYILNIRPIKQQTKTSVRLETVRKDIVPPKLNPTAIQMFPAPRPTTTQPTKQNTAPGVRVRTKAWNNTVAPKALAIAALKQAKEFQLPPKQRNVVPDKVKLKEQFTATDSKYNSTETIEIKGLMLPTGSALRHPAAEMLLEYAKIGCPVDCGEDWTLEKIEAAIKRGLSETAKDPTAAKVC